MLGAMVTMSTNSLYCAVCGAPFEIADVCNHRDAEHENPADDDVSYSDCLGMAYDSRKLTEEETEASVPHIQDHLATFTPSSR